MARAALRIDNRNVYLDTQGTQTVKICTSTNVRGVYEQYYRLKPAFAIEHDEMVRRIGEFTTIDQLVSWLMNDRKANREKKNETSGIVDPPPPPPPPTQRRQICTNGHIMTHGATFCETCGQKTITACQKCNKTIHIAAGLPSYCRECGASFPWTESRKKAVALFRQENHDPEALHEFERKVAQISKDTPEAQSASRWIKQQLAKLKRGASKAIYDIVINLACEAARRILMPGA